MAFYYRWHKYGMDKKHSFIDWIRTSLILKDVTIVVQHLRNVIFFYYAMIFPLCYQNIEKEFGGLKYFIFGSNVLHIINLQAFCNRKD